MANESMQAPSGLPHIRLSTDSSTNAVNTIDYAHHEIHGGSSFTADYTVELAN